SHANTVEGPHPAARAASSRGSPRPTAWTKARATGIVSLQGRPPWLRLLTARPPRHPASMRRPPPRAPPRVSRRRRETALETQSVPSVSPATPFPRGGGADERQDGGTDRGRQARPGGHHGVQVDVVG